MTRICPENGFVHLVFANTDDDYYTEHPIMMNFEKYITYILKKQHTKQIDYIFFMDSSFDLKTNDNKSAEKYSAMKNETVTVINSVFRRKAPVNDQQDNKVRQLEKVMRKGSTAVIIKAEDLYQIVNDPKKAQLFEKIKDYNNSNLLIIVFKPDEESFFKTVFPGNNGEGIFSVSQMRFFYDLLHDDYALYTFPVENLFRNQSAKKSLVFLNDLCYGDVLNFVKSYFFRTKKPESQDYEFIEWFAAVIHAWYNSTLFKCSYDIDFLSNPHRKIKIIEQSLNNQNIFNRVMTLAQNLKEEYKDDYVKELDEKDDHDAENIKLFFSKLYMDDLDIVHNIYSPRISSHIKTVQSVIQASYSCMNVCGLSGSENVFEPELFSSISAKIFPFAEAERELKKIIRIQSHENKNAENALSSCIEEVRSTFKTFHANKDYNYVASEMLLYHEGLYADLFFKAIQNYNNTVVRYRNDNFGDGIMNITLRLKYCDLIKVALKIIKNIALCKSGHAQDGDMISSLEQRMDEIVDVLDSENYVKISQCYSKAADFINNMGL